MALSKAELSERARARYRANPQKYKDAAAAWKKANRKKAKAYKKAWDVRNRAKSRGYLLKFKYGISPEMVDAMRVKQKGVCAICRTAPATDVDHDHKSSVVRALLCRTCNLLIGNAKESVKLFRACIAYLRKHGVKKKKLAKDAK